jgi:D-aminopeptidase
VPVGRFLTPPDGTTQPPDGATPQQPPARPGRGALGSCIVVLVTDGPLDAHGCARLARRAGLGLARTGSTASHGSGEIFLAAATGLRGGRTRPAAGLPVSGGDLDPYFAAAVEATEEAVVTALLAARTVTGRGGRTVAALPFDAVRELVEETPASRD